MLELQIDQELKAWIDPLSPDEYALLEASIVDEGCRDPLVVWAGYLLDGHNRYEICHKHGVEFTTFEKSGLATKEDVKIWMIQNQMGKRNATDFTRTALALKLKPLLEQRARERKEASKSLPGEKVGNVRQNSDAPTDRTDEGIGKMAGVSRDTVRKVERIIQNATDEVIAQVRTGEISIHAAAKTVTPPKPPKSAPTVATPRAPEPAPGPVEVIEPSENFTPEAPTMIEVDKEAYEEMAADYQRVLAENTLFGEVVEADDRLKAAMESTRAALTEAAKQTAIAENMKRTLDAKSGEFIERARAVTYWQNRAIKAEKALEKLEPKK